MDLYRSRVWCETPMAIFMARRTMGAVTAGPTAVETVFEVTPTGTETVLHSFQCAPDGSDPSANLIMDAKGNLYGTTGGGGSYHCGIIFEIPAGSTEKVLYSFQCPP